MKTFLLAMAVALTGFELLAQSPAAVPAIPAPSTNSLAERVAAAKAAAAARQAAGKTDQPGTAPLYQPGQSAPVVKTTTVPQGDEIVPMINFQGVDLVTVLDIYSQYVGRTVIRGTLPEAKIILKTTQPLTRKEVVQAIEAVLALNNISVVNVGEKFVKVAPSTEANALGGEMNQVGSTNIPSMGSYTTEIVQMKYIKPSEMIQVIQPFAKLQNSILAIDSNGILVLRDYAENVKRMLEMIERIDVSIPEEFINEVIPIRYAMVGEIASALNTLGGTSTTSIGSSGMGGGSPAGGMGTLGGGMMGGGMGSMGGGMGNRMGINTGGGMGGSMGGGIGGMARPGMGGVSPGGMSPGGGSSFQSRLNTIINRAAGGGGAAGGSDQIQIFGQAKIIADERSNSLLVYATKRDMEKIKEVISKIDVLQPQVVVEAIIMDVTIGKKFEFGVSAVQNPTSLGGNVTGAGGMKNGQPFFSFLKNMVSTASSNAVTSAFAAGAPSGLSYFGNIGNMWDLAVAAAESSSDAQIIQRPRIQTSHAKSASFGVGETVPYVTSTYGGGYNTGYGGSSYSQLFVGVQLNVTPFINTDGLVLMQIQQSVDELNGTQTITGVGEVPKTISRQLSSEIAVRDRDTVILGGFVRSGASHDKSGVPLLKDIPVLGNLFSSRKDSRNRTELLVLMRPTVLRTPEIAAQNTVIEGKRLPGVSKAAMDTADYERTLIEVQRKRELKTGGGRNSTMENFHGFHNLNLEGTNAPPPQPMTTNAVTEADQEKVRAALEEQMKAPQPAPDSK